MPDLSGPHPFELETLPDGTTVPLYIIRCDKSGACESPQARATLLSDLGSGAYTDVFLFSHGWNNTWGDAIGRYRDFFSGYVAMRAAQALAYARPVKPMLAGIFWPSTALTTSAERGPEIAAIGLPESQVVEPLIHELTGSLAYADAQRLSTLLHQPAGLSQADALETAKLLTPVYSKADDVLGAAKTPPTPEEIVAQWRSASTALLGGGNTSGVGGFAPSTTGGAGPAAGPGGPVGRPTTAGIFSYLDPRWIARLATVLQMKDRAGVVGAYGIGPLLRDVLSAAAAARVHLIGHSYGCKVVLSALCQDPLPAGTMVESVLLLQPAINYRCFAVDAGNGQPGGYRPAFDRVRQPIMTTLTKQDFPLTSVFHFAVRRPTDVGEVAAAAGDVTCANRVAPSVYAALGGYGPGGCANGECRIEVMRTDTPYEEVTAGSPVRIIALNGDDAITGHGDVANLYTYFALYSQLAG